MDDLASEYLNGQIPSLSIFLDTNFIFGILDLHSNPMSHVSKELLETIKNHNLPFKLYYHEATLSEFMNTIESIGFKLKGHDWAQYLSRALVESGHLDGFLLKYHKLNASSRIDPDVFLSTYEHAQDLLDGLGFTIYRQASSKTLDEERYELINRYDKYIKIHRRLGSKPYKALDHDILVLQTVRQLSPSGSSILRSSAFFITTDYYLYSFDWEKLRKPKSAGSVAMPNHLLQLIRPFISVNDDFNKRFVEAFAIPEFRVTSVNYEDTVVKTASYINSYKEPGWPEETVVKILSNELLLQKLNDQDVDSPEFKKILDDALIEENVYLLEKAEKLVVRAEEAGKLEKQIEDDALEIQNLQIEKNSIEEQYRKQVEQLDDKHEQQVSDLESRLEEEKKKRDKEISELLKMKKEKERTDKFLRLIGGTILFLILVMLIIWGFPKIEFISNHERKWGLYLATIIIIGGLIWALFDKAHWKLAIGGVVFVIIVELIQVL